MSRLEEVYDEGSRPRASVRAALLLAGSLVAVVGFVAATASLVAGFGLGKAGALKVATLLGGALLLGSFLVLFARRSAAGPSRLLASVGATFAVVGLALFWTTLPTGWTGRLAGLPTLAVGTYAAGLLGVVAAGFVAESDADGGSAGAADAAVETVDSGPIGGVAPGPSDPDATAKSSALGDGGAEKGKDLQFFEDEDA